MKVGFSSGNITPVGGKIAIAGCIPVRYTDLVHDDIKATAMVIQDENEQTVWVTCDICHPTKKLTDEVVCVLKDVLPNFSREQLILSTTHATACFYLTDEEALGRTFDIDYNQIMPLDNAMKQVVNGIVVAVMNAYSNCVEIDAEFAVADILTGYCRRVVYKDGTAVMYGNVHREDFLRMEYPDGGETQIVYFYKKNTHDLVGIFIAVPCPAQADESSLYITADYWAVVRNIVKSKLGNDVEVFGVCKAAGELSPHKMIKANQGCGVSENGYEAAKRIGERIADSVVKEKDRTILKMTANELVHKRFTFEIEYPIIKISKKTFEDAKEFFENKNNFDENGKAFDWRKQANSMRALNAYRLKQRFYKAYSSVLRIGNLLFYTTPCELFSEYAKRINTKFKQNPVIDVQLTNDCIGYLPTKEAISHGGYSTEIGSRVTT
ncbi:MAG: hypothetical protein IJX03_00560 [Clostridia bacterium]|nr:hypothetical protein [Clostridia bacterium]